MPLSRRSFLKKTSYLVATGLVAPHIIRANPSILGANDKVNVALIGCKNMGWGNLMDFMLHPEVNCAALCDIDEGVLKWRAEEIEKNHGMKPALYGDYRKLLEDKNIDIVIIGTPDHWHCLQFVDACAAGKDVYVEKPIANSIAECDAMVAAAQRYNTIVQVGQQQRSSKHWQEMVKYLRSGQLGDIGRVHVWANFNYAAMQPPVPDSDVPAGVDFETWLGPTPKKTFNAQRFHGSWRMFWDYGGGLLTDWGVHLLDMGLWGMDVQGMPLSVQATGGNFLYPNGAHETYDTMSVTYRFPKHIMTWENNAGVETGPYGKCYGVLFRGTNGTLVANRDDWEVIPEGTKIAPAKMAADYQDHRDHVTNFLECVKTRNRNTACTIQNGSLCAKYAQIGNISARIGGKTLVYDDAKKKFDNGEANKYLKPKYRSPWKFPNV